MSIFDQMKMAGDMLKGMSPDQIQNIMQQAKESKTLFEEQIKKAVAEEIERRGLVTREEVEKMIAAKFLISKS